MDKLQEAATVLEKAFLRLPEDDPIVRAGIVKSFEVALEYAWKEMKSRAIDAGLEAYSPKDCVRVAAKLGLIESPEKWIVFINIRNLSVHDYIGVSDEDFDKALEEFVKELSVFIKKLD